MPFSDSVGETLPPTLPILNQSNTTSIPQDILALETEIEHTLLRQQTITTPIKTTGSTNNTNNYRIGKLSFAVNTDDPIINKVAQVWQLYTK